ncbi:PREDICTED: extensin-like [Cyprinodon variegatus]|uniref:extensin-like n=1 Tax=Cyprinodon variegatus TaxID=28743 RepID=UPI000742BCAD|nr:PREDICTED: extensin-like [Cyprinodon variegatus]
MPHPQRMKPEQHSRVRHPHPLHQPHQTPTRGRSNSAAPAPRRAPAGATPPPTCPVATPAVISGNKAAPPCLQVGKPTQKPNQRSQPIHTSPPTPPLPESPRPPHTSGAPPAGPPTNGAAPPRKQTSQQAPRHPGTPEASAAGTDSRAYTGPDPKQNPNPRNPTGAPARGQRAPGIPDPPRTHPAVGPGNAQKPPAPAPTPPTLTPAPD